MPEVAADELTLGRHREIEQGRGAPPSEQERAAHARFQANPVVVWVARQFEEHREELRAASELSWRVSKLPPSQQRRYEKVKVRDAPRYLRLVPATRGPAVDAAQPREHAAPAVRPRERRARRASTSSRGSSDDPPDPPPALARIRGVSAASTRLVVHLERRRAATRLA
jgi:hypothetical protein